MRLLAVFVGLSLNAEGSKTSCAAVPEILVQLKTSQCCASPLKATIAFLEGSTPTTGACGTYLASQRFERFREWITLMGGYVSPKISFQRGHFVDSVSGKARVGYGGIFLNAYEYLHQSEMLFSIPERATFSESMISRHIPTVPRFTFLNSDKLWLSIGLAALLKHYPAVVGPWQALLPDMRSHPVFWPDSDMHLLRGTQAAKILGVSRETVRLGCLAALQQLVHLDLSCDEVKEAFAIITSRAFGLNRLSNPREQSSAIPFGPDLLNHSPHSASWISRVIHGPEALPDRIDTVFFLVGFVLSESRELFNNYGKHALPAALASYGFTQPDSKDELVILATTDGDFDGKRFDVNNFTRMFCPAKVGITDLVTRPPTCPAVYGPRDHGMLDSAGYFRLTDKDVVLFSHEDRDVSCSTTVDGLVWRYVKRQLRPRNVIVEPIQFTVPLNVMNGAEPLLPFPIAVWTALCAIPTFTSIAFLNAFIESASTCSVERNKFYLEEYPLGPIVKALSRLALFNICAFHEFETLEGLHKSLRMWIAYRNLRVKRQFPSADIEGIPNDLTFPSNVAFIRFLERIVSRTDRVFTDGGGLIDATTAAGVRTAAYRVHRLEEIYRYKMQSAYMVMMKCRQPLESVVPSFY